MSQNTRISDDWGWFPPLMGTPKSSDEVILVRDGTTYKATQEQMSRADGQGWVWLVDSINTSENKQSISSGTRTQLTINGLGSDTSIEYRDGLPPNIWSDDKFKPSAVGESYLIRLQFMLTQTQSGNNHYADISLDIGDGGSNIIWDSTYSIIKGQGVEAFVSFAIPVFVRDGFYNNGGRFFIEATRNIEIWDRRIMIQRLSKP